MIDTAIEKMTEMDAAGYALILLRCDCETDIRRTVEGYVHAAQYIPSTKAKDYDKRKDTAPIQNVKEATAMGTVNSLGVPFNWYKHASACGMSDGLDHGNKPSLMEALTSCTDPSSALEHRLIYFSRLYDIVGKPESARTEIQQQYLDLLRKISLLKRREKKQCADCTGLYRRNTVRRTARTYLCAGHRLSRQGGIASNHLRRLRKLFRQRQWLGTSRGQQTGRGFARLA